MNKIRPLSSGRSQGSWRDRHIDKKPEELRTYARAECGKLQGAVMTARRGPKAVLGRRQGKNDFKD